MQESFTVLDIFGYKSLRRASIIFSILILLVDFIYYAHSTIIDRIGFNATLNQALISSSEMVGVVLSLILAIIFPRKFSGIILYFLSFALSMIGFIVKVPASC